jgi:hypothetical protein
VEFFGGEQALPSVLGIQIGGDQLQCRQVIAGDPGCAVRIQDVSPILQFQREPAVIPQGAHPKHSGIGKVAVVAVQIKAVLIKPGRIEYGLEGWFGEAKVAPQIIHREVTVRQQF